jgi:taspase, threonine aspartase, 1
MQDSDIAARNLHLSERLTETWKRVRKIPKSFYTPFGRTGRNKVEVLPSLFRSGDPTPFESDRNNPPLSSASMDQIQKMNREIHGRSTISVGPAIDGAGDKQFSASRSASVAAIFVHAGAGYHSTTNEHVHLSACKE